MTRKATVEALVEAMALHEKIGQMTQPDVRSVTPDDVSEYALGSVLSGGGANPDPNTASDWRDMVVEMVEASKRSRLGIPIIYGSDAVHGHSNVWGATIFPHNIGLGAAGSAELVEQVHQATAIEAAATGVRWAFAPTVAVALDERWGRCYESFGSDPALVARLGAAAVSGLQSAVVGAEVGVAACAKHFVADGATEWGTAGQPEWCTWWDGWGEDWNLDQGDARIDESALRSVHLAPYRRAVDAGLLTVMASYSSWNGEKIHGSRYLLTDVLKGELGFGGLVVSDWMGIDQLDPDPRRCVVMALNAGIDMVMVPDEYRRFIDDAVAAVESGSIPVERIDDAVTRILRVKAELGLLDGATPEVPEIDRVGCAEHRALGRKAVAESTVLLKCLDGALPLDPGAQSILVAGGAADDIGLQCGGWTIDWAGNSGPTTTGTTILDALRTESDSAFSVIHCRDLNEVEAVGSRRDVGLVVVAEEPYVEGGGDRSDLALSEPDVALVKAVRPLVDRLVLVVLSGRPLGLDRIVEDCDAVVAGWLPGTEGAGLVDVLTATVPFGGRLPRPWGPAWKLGYGLSLG